MPIRTTKTAVTFASPFVLGDFDEVLPAGIYQVETDEELLEGLSFPAYRRKSTVIHLHAEAGHPGRMRSLQIDPKELDAALERDQRATTARVSRTHVKESPGKSTDTLRKEKKSTVKRPVEISASQDPKGWATRTRLQVGES